MNPLRVGALLLLSTPGWAAYQYYFTDNLTSINAASWSTTGNVGASSLGLAASESGGGTLISRIPIPDGTYEAEVRTTLKLGSSGGTYTSYLQASTDAATSGSGSGTYLAFEMQNPQFDPDGGCAANFLVLQRTGGVVSLLSSFAGTCRDGMVLRMAVHGNVLLVWPDQDAPMEFVGVTPGAGQPGIGAYGAPSGNAIAQVQLGTIYRTAPNAVDSQTLAVSAFPRHIDLQWKPAPTASASIGFAGYWIYRDGLYFRRTTATTFSDETVSPGENHTYVVNAVDQHYNFSAATSVTVTVPPFATLTGTPPPLPGGMQTPPALPRMAGLERGLEPHTAPPPPNGAFDPRRVGVMALGSYWGGAGEQIDTLSRNLNFSVPLLSAKSAGGGSVTFGLSYNSQMWRQDSAGNWLIGEDVGFGLGWKVLAGAITPIWSGSQIVYYLYVDSSGAEYHLDQNVSGSLWTSVMGTYVTYDASAEVLHFTDGSLWTMGSISASGEQDAGSLYPTVMEDSNGNQIAISYLAGMGSSSANTSARINWITDPRSPGGYAYQFSYSTQCSNGQCFAHLSTITNGVGTPENYTFAYAANQSLASPFNSSSYGTWAFLQSVTVTGLNIAHQFQYDGSGEMTQLTTPLGGVMQWTYRSFTYGTNVTLREVLYRYMPMFAGESWCVYGPDSYDETQPFHAWTAIQDSQANSYKIWEFQPNSFFYTVPKGADTVALLNVYGEGAYITYSYTLMKWYEYTIDQLGQPYTWQVGTMPDYGTTGSLPYTYTNQTLDIYGNLTQAQVFDYGNTSGTPTRTYNLTYLHNIMPEYYVALYIRNRLTSATLTTSAGTTTLVTNSYDGNSSLQASNDTSLRDPNYINTPFLSTYWFRGNVTSSSTLNASPVYSSYFDTGVAYSSWDATGDTVTTSLASNDVLPQTLTPNSNPALATSMTYNSAWAVTSVTGPNGATSTTNFDSYGRPATSTSSDGAVTSYTYAYYTSGGQNSQTATVNNGQAYQFKTTVLDGFGRTISVLTGNGKTTVSETDTQYAPCACSPLGKISAVSMPYAPGGTRVWTRYTYDSSGRTLTIVKPDGASTTTYAYAANQTTVTDPAGRWKTFTSDAFGNLRTVTEPDPNLGTVYTTYTYNNANQLLTVSMTRAGVNQTRTFGWTGSDLTSAQNPENGTVNYTYDGAHHVLTRSDAKGQQTNYTYDIYGRLLLTQHLVGGTVDPTQTVTYTYDSTPAFQNLPSLCCSNTAGRLAAVQFPNSNHNANSNDPGAQNSVQQFIYLYSYNQAGRVTFQDMRLVGGAGADLYATYLWDNMGRMTAMNYPFNGPQVAMTYDAMSNLSSETELCQSWSSTNCQNPGFLLPLANATYDFAGRLTTLNYNNFSITGVPYFNGQNYPYPWLQTETHTYNSLAQLTNITNSPPSYYGSVGAQVNMTYNFSATQNNGRIVSSADGVTGENVSYTYDSLNRLIAAATTNPTGPIWGNSYSYDGFGNLTGKTVTQGTAPSALPQVNSATNQARMIGDYGFDANGNWLGMGSQSNAWNVENQLISNGMVDYGGNPLTYTYDPWGKRVLQYSVGGIYGPTGTIYFYSITGQRLAIYTGQYPNELTQTSVNMYFGSRLLAPVDRLGSVRQNGNGPIAYYPWGEERTSTPDGTDKFGTYFRDATNNGIGEDYASARYYNNNFGRFWSADPAGKMAANPADPISWNRYAYVSNDPINKTDPLGFCSPNDDPPCYSVTVGLYLSFGGGGGGPGPAGVNPAQFALDLADTRGKLPPTLSPAKKKEQKMFGNAIGLATKLLTNKPDCAKDFGGTAASAISTLDNATYKEGLVFGADANGNPTDVPNQQAYASTNPTSQTVTINLSGNFFNISPTTTTVDGLTYSVSHDMGTGLGQMQFDAFVLLHELGHLTGVLGNDVVNPALADAFNEKILKDCFGVNWQPPPPNN
jgi:RHS repeat-associated protein